MKTRSLLIAGAAASLLLSGALAANAAEGEGEVVCLGINACKGQGGCHTATNACSGQNGCKGQGATKTTAAECKAKGGKVREEKK